MGCQYLKALEEYKHGQKFICVKTGKESIVIQKVNYSYYNSNIIGFDGVVYDSKTDRWAKKVN